MNGVVIKFKDDVSPVLTRAMRNIGDFSKPLKLSGMYMQKSFSRQFETSGKPTWKPLSAQTISRRRKKSSKPLQNTGRLKRSYIGRGSGSVWALTKYRLEIGSNLSYAAVHQYGKAITRTSGAGSARLRRRKASPTGWSFARASFKGKTRSVNWQGGKTYTINIPARPLDFQPEDYGNIGKIFKEHCLESLK